MRRLLGISLALMLSTSYAHMSLEIVPIQLAAHQWVTAAQSEDIEAMKPLVTEDFSYLGRPALIYFSTIEMVQLRKISFEHATYSIDGDSATVSPILYTPYREMYNTFAWTMRLRRVDGQWRVEAIEPGELPDDFVPPDHPHHHVLHNVSFTIRDGQTGNPIIARVHIRDKNGEYWPPQGHRKRVALGWRADIGGVVVVDGKTFAYVKPDFVASLPQGEYIIEARRGLEYEAMQRAFTVDGQPQTIDLELNRWTHMTENGWYSGDTHTHFLDPHFGMLEAQGEDLNILHSLASSGGNLSTQLAHFTGAPSVLSTDENIFYMSEETRHDYLGHTVLMGLKKFIFPFGWGPPLTGVHGGYDYPTMAHQADKAHEQGAVVAWSHLPHPHAELPIDVALGKIDAVETFVFGDPFKPHPSRVQMGDYSPDVMSPLTLWYALLNTGTNMPGVGGTDKMWNTQVVGAVRTYVQLDGGFSYESWLAGLKAGRNFVSTGAMIDFRLADARLGDTVAIDEPTKIPFSVTAHSNYELKKLEIVINGEVVAKSNSTGAKTLTLEGEIDVDQSSWVAARAYNDEPLPTQRELTGSGSLVLAHTSPVYVSLKGQPRTNRGDARFLRDICEKTIGWAENMANYHNEAQRDEVVALYNKGCDVYRRQAD